MNDLVQDAVRSSGAAVAANPASAPGGQSPEALLQQLRDIQTPVIEASSVAPGLLLAAVALVLPLMLFGIWLLRRKTIPKWRSEAHSELEEIQQLLDDGDRARVLPACSRLLRRVVLALEPRENVAALTGLPWLRKLDQLHGSMEFTVGCGKCLNDVQYKRTPDASCGNLSSGDLQDDDLQAVLDLCSNFIAKAGNFARPQAAIASNSKSPHNPPGEAESGSV